MPKQYTASEAGIEIATIQMHLEREARKYRKAIDLNLEGQQSVALMRTMLTLMADDAVLPDELSVAIELMMGMLKVSNTLAETV